MTVRLVIRGFCGRTRIFEDRVVVREEDLENLARDHLLRLKDYPKHMIEIEFLDEPDIGQRFFRFGTDPSGMVRPIGISLDE